MSMEGRAEGIALVRTPISVSGNYAKFVDNLHYLLICKSLKCIYNGPATEEEAKTNEM